MPSFEWTHFHFRDLCFINTSYDFLFPFLKTIAWGRGEKKKADLVCIRALTFLTVAPNTKLLKNHQTKHLAIPASRCSAAGPPPFTYIHLYQCQQQLFTGVMVKRYPNGEKKTLQIIPQLKNAAFLTYYWFLSKHAGKLPYIYVAIVVSNSVE